MSGKRRIVALSGGVGGAKLAQGLDMLDDVDLTIVVNTGDDFEHLGLMISPDIDSVVYALAGLSDVDRGWGRADESWHFMEEIRRLGGEDWFLLGDRDLAIAGALVKPPGPDGSTRPDAAGRKSGYLEPMELKSRFHLHRPGFRASRSPVLILGGGRAGECRLALDASAAMPRSGS